ncbi:MAG TPA: molybdate ABC transporter substrate-binding protein [Pirellulales bacterium]|nr:molybdate ABC transporter substrate-binding protein [Pirellulales bacterium]
MMRGRNLLGGLLAATLAGGCGAPERQTPVVAETPATENLVFFAAASTREPVLELIAAFEREHAGARVRASFSASSTLAQQLAAGAEGELFLSADEAWARFLSEKRLAADQCPLLGNRLVLIVPAGSQGVPKAPEDLLADDIERIALGDPRAVPVGRYAKRALTKLDLWERLKSKVVGAPDARRALAFVEMDSADAGVVYATDAAVSTRVRVAFEFDRDLTEPIVYPLVLLEAGRDKPLARALFEFLQSGQAAKIFERHGFEFLANESLKTP